MEHLVRYTYVMSSAVSLSLDADEEGYWLATQGDRSPASERHPSATDSGFAMVVQGQFRLQANALAAAAWR